MFKRIAFSSIAFIFFNAQVAAHNPHDHWQQYVHYTIHVALDTQTNYLTGHEVIDYTNNSPDTLHQLFFHLFWNAFQPNSSMDIRSRELGKIIDGIDKSEKPILDWDSRIADKIAHLSPSEMGSQDIQNVLVNGHPVKTKVCGTIVQIFLEHPLHPKSVNKISLSFKAHVPIMIRRAGRGVHANQAQYTMAQWYPKLAEYDYLGWHPTPYIQREFYGVYGTFNVYITLPSKFMVAATGLLLNADSIGYGYTDKIVKHHSSNLVWHFQAHGVHDFVWGADTAYRHIRTKVDNRFWVNLFYKPTNPSEDSLWQNYYWGVLRSFPYIESHFGRYPYLQYSFIQGGDGGMEYPQACMIAKPSSQGIFLHELMHNWFQGVLGNNENLEAYLDEGFVTFAEEEIIYYYNTHDALQSPYLLSYQKAALAKKVDELKNNITLKHNLSYNSYFKIARSPNAEPLSTPADYYETNMCYGLNVYAKGSVFLNQLSYIVGDSAMNKIFLSYYNLYRLHHPTIDDFIKIAEKVSHIQLFWYKDYWINSIKTIDYTIGDIYTDSLGRATVTIKRNAKMPMPIDVVVTYKDSTKEFHYIPLNLMFGGKTLAPTMKNIIESPWDWVATSYNFIIERRVNEIASIEIDPSHKLAALNRPLMKIVIPH
ncbi:MAG: M1 family metallopeptidase [Phycisphaerales bacterium]|nr:M1 family metallopeptidase [Phycisphaerales bacterium]